MTEGEKMEFTIKRASEDQLDGIDDFYNEIIDYLTQTRNYPGWQKGIHPTRAEAVEAAREGAFYVAEAGGDLCGTMIMNHTAEAGFSDAHWQVDAPTDKVCVIHSLAVHPAYMRKGLGRQFVAYALDTAKKQGAKEVRLSILKGNTPAVHLYETSGFSYVATVSLGYEEIGLPWFDLYEKTL